MRDREQREPTKMHFLSLTRRTPDCLLLSPSSAFQPAQSAVVRGESEQTREYSSRLGLFLQLPGKAWPMISCLTKSPLLQT